MIYGLQLSFAGTIGIVIFNSIILNKLKKIKLNIKIAQILSVTISAQILIMPIVILHFNSLSITFFISNLFAGIIFGAIIILGFIVFFLSFISMKISISVSVILNFLLDIIRYIAKYTSMLPGSSIVVTTPNIFLIVLYYILVTIIFLNYKLKSKKITNIRFTEKKLIKFLKKIRQNRIYLKFIYILIPIMLVSFIFLYIPKELKIYFIDVGQRRFYINNNA